MSKFLLFLAVVFASAFGSIFAQAQNESGLKTVTLHSFSAHEDSRAKDCFSFENETAVGCTGGGKIVEKSDLRYGGLRIGDDWDWFDVASGAQDVCSKIVNIGKFEWTDSFIVPVIEPFPKLKEGERRIITIDASGAHGKPGAPGAPGKNADGSIDLQSVIKWGEAVEAAERSVAPPSKPPKVDAIFAKAVVGNLYAMRVVNKDRDYYILFRVEALKRGESCTISWKRIAAPEK